MINKLQTLCEKSNNEYGEGFDYSREKGLSLSMEIRVTLVSVVRCILFYGTHISGFIKEPKQLVRISYSEKQAELDLTALEQGTVDEKRKDEELENLGPLGFKNSSQ